MDSPTQKAGGGMEAFFTRKAANEGIQLPLYLPSGEKSAHWLRIRGVDSDEFRAADAESRRDVMRLAQIEDPIARGAEVATSKRRLVASLVMAWSFDNPCTVEAVMEFLHEAPQVADAIDTAATRRKLFFAVRSSNLPAMPSTSSDST